MADMHIDNPIPKHIAFIIDGNRRWAKENNRTAFAGHYKGLQKCIEMVDICMVKNIKSITFFIISQENMLRHTHEVTHLLRLVSFVARRFRHISFEKGLRIKCIGDIHQFPSTLLKQIQNLEHDTKNHDKFNLNVALNYGGQWDITQAIQKIALQVQKGEINPQLISSTHIQQHLNLSDQPPPDILIRTGGYKRLSNFLLWDIAYTELFFLDKLWPEITFEDIDDVIDQYQKIPRNHGK